jgi:short-subunit dehydrogenase
MKNCWILGASSGIGFELAKKLCKNGYNITASARSLENLNILKNQIEDEKKSSQNPQNFGEISVENVDVEDYQSLKNTWQNILAKNHKIDLVIFASAIYEQMDLRDFDLDLAKKIMHVNFDGFLNFLHLIVPHFMENKSGHIATIASVAGYRGLPKSLTYGASKSAMINLCEGIYPELKAHNISLSVINPGFVKTRLTAKNKFPMPFLISQEQASDYIYQGLMAKKFEIHFPKKFTFILKFLRIIPYKIYLPIVNNIYRKNLK